MTRTLITRRSVLRAGVLGAVAAAVPVGAIELFAGGLVPANSWTMAQFQRLVGTTFRAGPHGTALTLAGVRNLLEGGRRATTSQECYMLTFTGAAGAAALANTQVLRHPSLGQFAMLLVDGGVKDGVQSWVATVNRL